MRDILESTKGGVAKGCGASVKRLCLLCFVLSLSQENCITSFVIASLVLGF
ncbi:MAG: hypothetical protein IKI43_06480 [Campylobacter sp.]|nr:hypothetical protein [Campylobacter sp.]MBR7047986.1 hypothetical protein [Campylobacter sp.]